MNAARKPHPLLFWSLVTAMTLVWALNPLVGKIALRHFPPLLLIAVRTSLAALAILPIWLARDERKPIPGRDWPRLLFLTVGLLLGNQVLFVVALSRTSVAHSAFLYCLVPAVVLLMAAVAGQERLTLGKLGGMALATAGVVLLANERGGGAAAPTLLGDALTLVAVVVFAAFSVLGKHERARYGPLTLTAIAYVGGGLLFQPVVWLGYRGFDWGAVPAAGWWALLYMALLPAVVGYLIYFWALGHAPASKIASVQYIQPPLAAGLSALLLGEALTPMLGWAGGLILLGLISAERARMADERAAAAA